MSEIVANSDRHLPLWAPMLSGGCLAWETVFAGYVAQVDFPGAAVWQDLVSAFPSALVVLSVRPAEDWYRSASETIFQLDDSHASSPFKALWKNWLGDGFSDRAMMIKAYERHNNAVRSAVPRERLLEWNVADGWAPLGNRLGVSVPDEYFPRTNSAEQFRVANALGAGTT